MALSPEAQIQSRVQEALGLFDKYELSKFCSYIREPRIDLGEIVQMRGIFKRLAADTAKGISEHEAVLLAMLATSRNGSELEEGGKKMYHDDNPFSQTLELLRQYGLVKTHDIHIEIHQQPLQPNQPMELNSEVLDQVYDALKKRIDRLAQSGSRGSIFLKSIFDDRAGDTPRGKFEAVMRILDLGGTEDLARTIFMNRQYHDALRDACEKTEDKGPVTKAAEAVAEAARDTDEGKLPRRGFFRMLSEMALGASVAVVADPLVKKAEALEGMDARIALAQQAIQELDQHDPQYPVQLQKVLSELAERHPSAEAARGAVGGALAHYIAENDKRDDPMTHYLLALEKECGALRYPIYKFSAQVETSRTGRSNAR